MTKRHRSFAAATKNPEPLSFDIGEETFNARPSIPGVYLMELIANLGDDTAKSLGQILEFFKAALPEDEYARFNTFIHDPSVIVEMTTLVEIMSYLVEEYSDRPKETESSK